MGHRQPPKKTCLKPPVRGKRNLLTRPFARRKVQTQIRTPKPTVKATGEWHRYGSISSNNLGGTWGNFLKPGNCLVVPCSQRVLYRKLSKLFDWADMNMCEHGLTANPQTDHTPQAAKSEKACMESKTWMICQPHMQLLLCSRALWRCVKIQGTPKMVLLFDILSYQPQ